MAIRRLLLMLLMPGLGCAADWVALPAQPAFNTVLRYQDTDGAVAIAAFEMMATPVTNAQFLDFVKRQPAWSRERTPSVFAEARYLQHWRGALELGEQALPQQPVTWVSWFAAQAFCEDSGGRLPSWSEWEYAAAADALRPDARDDPAWRERILSWYSKPSNQPLDSVGQAPANVFRVHDLHGLVWEWVEDYAAMLVSSDNRQQADPDLLQFCGAGALSTEDRENYAVLMRIAMLSALQAKDATANLGFRCARDIGTSQ